MASKKKLLDRMNKAISDIQEMSKSKSIRKYDWKFAPVVTDGKVNVGFKKSPLTAEEVWGEGQIGPVPKGYDKSQYINRDGKIVRTVNNPSEEYSMDQHRRYNVDDYYSNPRLESKDISRRWTERRTYSDGSWLQDLNGNWYKSGKDLEIPLSEARKIKANTNAMQDVDMRGKKDDTRKVDAWAQNRMKAWARRSGVSNDDPYKIRDYNSYYSAESDPNLMMSSFMRDAKKKADDARTKNLGKQIDFTIEQNDIREQAIRDQINELQLKLKEMQKQGFEELNQYENMKNSLRKYPDIR